MALRNFNENEAHARVLALAPQILIFGQQVGLAQILPQQLMHYVHYAIEHTLLCVPSGYSLMFESNELTSAFVAHAAAAAADFQSRARAAATVPIYGTRMALLLLRLYSIHYRMS